MYIDLGNISEDVLKDGRRFYENGLSTPNIPAAVDTTHSVWGTTPVNPFQVTNAFSNDPADRTYQDAGFDGLRDDGEKIKQSQYLQDISTNFGASSAIFQKANTDPSGDDYVWYRDAGYDAAGTGILGRYKNFNNPQGNSPVADNSGSPFSPAATLYPDNEDLNRDNTLNETEEYYEYQVDLKPGMDVGFTKYITDKKIVTPRLPDGTSRSENWFLFRVPIKDFTNRIGQIPDFKSIRFIRMYLNGFEDSVVLRFASMDLVRNQWRTFTYELDTVGGYVQLPANSPTTFNVLAVNVEENSSRQPIPYKIPPGIERVQLLSNNGVNLLQNEQSMSLKVSDLAKNDSRAVFKTLNLDLRQYGRLQMYLHAESVIGQTPVNDGQLVAVIRIGQDFLNNYYEIKIPLTTTALSSTATAEEIWPELNNLDLQLNDLVQLKLRRNGQNYPVGTIYREQVGAQTYSLLGNPNLGEVEGMLIGIENTTDPPAYAEVWVNELRLSQLDEHGGMAALGRVDLQLADLGTLSVSANTYTNGFGSIEQKVNERAKDNLVQFDAALNIDAGKLLPQKIHVSIPVYASINKTILTPQFDPYNLDVKYKDELTIAGAKKDSVKKAAIDQTTIKTLNFTNVRFGQANGTPKLWSPSNFDFSYSFTRFEQTNSLILLNRVDRHRGGFGYTYNASSKFIEPFKRLIKNKSVWLTPIKDININPIPSLISFRADINRQFGQYVPRIVNTYDSKVERVDTTYDKFFTFDRYYNFRWDLTRSLNLDFSATNFGRVDEPFGKLDTKAKKDTVKTNFYSLGRNTLYQQRATASYNFPFSKLPITDFINARYSYTTTYNWIGASLLAVNLGNTIENSQQNNLTTELDFTRLYGKSKWLTKITADNPDEAGQGVINDSIQPAKPRAEIVQDLKGFEKRNALQKWRKQKMDYRIAERKAKSASSAHGLANAAGHIITMVKRTSINYSESYNSRVPGYTAGIGYNSKSFNTAQPGFDYVFGKQPDSSWLNRKASEGAITRDSLFNILFTQNFQQQLNVTAQLEPIKEFTIDLSMQKSFTKNYSELYKDVTGVGDDFAHLSPLATGGFSVSYISFKTLFKKSNPNEVSQTFKTFETNRLLVANRLAQSNPYWQALPANEKFGADGFPTGYSRYAQDVLIPSFLAAYTGKNASGVSLIKQANPAIKTNPFSGIKALPNWRFTYTGLSKLPALSELFSNITITHGYSSTLSMNSYNSALLYADPLHYSAPSFIDTISGNYVPFFLVPNITIQEQFAPLIGIDITTNSQASLRFEYQKSRQLSLSLIDYQLAETRSTGITFGGSWRKKGVKLPFKLPFIKADPDQTDLNISLDMSLRDDITSNSILDQASAFGTGGQRVISIQPSIDYVVSSRVDLKFYFDQQRVKPYISTAPPITNTRAGLQITISLAPNQ